MSAYRRLRYWWRRWRGRCVLCGGPVPHRRLPDTYAYWPSPWACRWCNKAAAHATNYGMSGDVLKQRLTQ